MNMVSDLMSVKNRQADKEKEFKNIIDRIATFHEISSEEDEKDFLSSSRDSSHCDYTISLITPSSYKKKRDPNKIDFRKLEGRNRKVNIALIPKLRIIKRDIRRRYIDMHSNVVNSHDPDLLLRFLKEFCAPNCKHVLTYRERSKTRVSSGIEGIYNHTVTHHQRFPDCVQFFSNTQIQIALDKPGSRIISSVVFKGTKIVDLEKDRSDEHFITLPIPPVNTNTVTDTPSSSPSSTAANTPVFSSSPSTSTSASPTSVAAGADMSQFRAKVAQLKAANMLPENALKLLSNIIPDDPSTPPSIDLNQLRAKVAQLKAWNLIPDNALRILSSILPDETPSTAVTSTPADLSQLRARVAQLHIDNMNDDNGSPILSTIIQQEDNKPKHPGMIFRVEMTFYGTFSLHLDDNNFIEMFVVDTGDVKQVISRL